MAKYRVVALTAVVLLCALFASRLMAAEMQGVMMQGGKMMKITDGKATGPMNSEMTMSDDTKVMTDGTVKMKDGLRREAAWRNVVTPEGIQVPSESLGLSIIGHSMM